MCFWTFIRDMFVFDWLFGHSKRKSVCVQRQRESRRYDNNCLHDDCAQQDFDDDLDSGMIDDDF